MKEKILLDKNRNIAQVVSDSFKFIKQEFSGLISHYLVFIAPLFIGLIYLAAKSDLLVFQQKALELSNETEVEAFQELLREINLNSVWLVGIAMGLISLVFLGVTLIYLRNYHFNPEERITYSEMGSQLLYEFPKLFIVQFFYLSMSFFGMMTFLLPGIYFLITFSIASIIMVFEDEKIFKSFSKSIRTTHKSWFTFFWHTINIFLVYMAISFILRLPISLLIKKLYPLEEITAFQFAFSIGIESFINILASAIALIGMSMLYFGFTNHRQNYRDLIRSEFNKSDKA